MTTNPTTSKCWQFSLRASLAVITLTCAVGAIVYYVTRSIIPAKVLIFGLGLAGLSCVCFAVGLVAWIFSVIVDAAFPPNVPFREAGEDD